MTHDLFDQTPCPRTTTTGTCGHTHVRVSESHNMPKHAYCAMCGFSRTTEILGTTDRLPETEKRRSGDDRRGPISQKARELIDPDKPDRRRTWSYSTATDDDGEITRLFCVNPGSVTVERIDESTIGLHVKFDDGNSLMVGFSSADDTMAVLMHVAKTGLQMEPSYGS